MTEPGLLQDFKRSVEAFAREQLAPGARERAHSPHYPKETAGYWPGRDCSDSAFPRSLAARAPALWPRWRRSRPSRPAARAARTSSRPVTSARSGRSRSTRPLSSGSVTCRPARRRADHRAGHERAEAGSAVTELMTTATRHGHGYLVNGTKVFSTHSADADVFLVYLGTGPGRTASARCYRSRQPGTGRRGAIAFHERRALVPALLRRLLRPDEQVLLARRGI